MRKRTENDGTGTTDVNEEEVAENEFDEEVADILKEGQATGNNKEDKDDEEEADNGKEEHNEGSAKYLEIKI